MRVLVPDLAGIATPIGGVVVAAIPYDRDSVIAAMEARAPAPRPHTRTLDSLFHAFHGPFLAFSRAAWAVEQATRIGDSAQAARLRPEMERTRAELSAARDTLWPRIEALRVEARQWQLSTFAGYDTAARSLARSRMRTLGADTTDATGWATLRVAPGPWWITARSPDPQDPNFEWYWNVPLAGDTVRLNPATGRRHPRY